MADILIIEDEISICILLDMFLRHHGHCVTYFPNGKLGLDFLNRGNIPDILILDLFWNNANCNSFLDEIRRNSHFSHLPILIMTGAAPNSAMLPPAHTYQGLIMKPFDLDDMALCINRIHQ